MQKCPFYSFCVLVLLLLLLGRVASAGSNYEGNDLAVFTVMLPIAEPHSDKGRAGYLLVSTGEWIIPPKYSTAENFYGEKLAVVTSFDGTIQKNVAGYVDLQGNEVVKPGYDSANAFSEGLANVLDCGRNKNLRTLFIDYSGKVVIDLSVQGNDQKKVFSIDNYHEGLASILDTQLRVGFVDRTGKIVIQPKFYEAEQFSEGVSVVRVRQRYYGLGGCGVINKVGEYLIIPQFCDLKSFSEGVAAVQAKPHSLWGYIDKTGKEVIAAQYTEVGSFVDGLAPALVHGKWGYINHQGEFVIVPQFDDAREFAQGMARVAYNDDYGWIDKKGNWIVFPLFTQDAVYFSKQNIVYDRYYYDSSGKKLNHYANHMTDAYDAMAAENYKAAITAFELALKINADDQAASWGLELAKDSEQRAQYK